MKKIKWTEKYSVNVVMLDKQHRELFDITNDVIQNLTESNIDTQFHEHLKRLREYSRKHFDTEERYIRNHAPELLKEQQCEHKKFEETLQNFLREYLNNKEGISVKMLRFLVNWLRSHILEMDQKYKKDFSK